MKILRLKLVNFIGIQNGMKKSEIEIIFPENNNHINMLLGKNGSGKSTILSQLTPFKDSFDDRKSLIIPGKEGLKEIDIKHNGHIYKIKHVYSKTSSSFISEDGVELNESGGVRTFEELIKQKFKLDKEYFKIGKIGSNTTNFIQFTTAQRKAYISIFVDAVQKYLESYDIVSKKVKDQENQIKQISADLKKFDSSKVIVENIDKTQKILDDLDKDIQQLTKRDAELNVEIKNLNKKLSDINYLESKSRLTEKEKLLKKSKQLNEVITKNYPDINSENILEKITKLQENLNKYKSDIQVLENQVNSANINKVSLENETVKINSQLKKLNQTNLDEYQTNINKLQAENENIKNIINSDNNKKTYYKNLFVNSEKNNNFLESFKAFLTVLLEEYSVLNESTIDPAKKNIELFFSSDFVDIFGNYVKTVNHDIEDQEKLLEEKQAEYSKKYSNLNKLEILKKRPENCRINTCPFISDALQYEHLDKELEELNGSIVSIKNSLNLSKKKAEELSDIRISYSNIVREYKSLLPRENVIYKYFISNTSIINILQEPYNSVVKKYNDVVQEAESIMTKINTFKTNSEKLKLLNIQYEKAKNSEETRKYFLNNLESINESLTNYTDQLHTLQENLSKNNKQYKDTENLLNDLKTLNESYTETDNINKEILELNRIIETYEQLSKNKNELTEDQKIIQNKLNVATDNKNKLNNDLTNLKVVEITVNNLNKNLKVINDSYNDTNLVKQALNPKSGIPLIFIQSYLSGTEYIANQLLNIAFNGKFEIKFLPTANDFFIQVRSGDDIIEDIKLASQGEIALTTISISLALIERSLGEFNIVYLDEIDGPLDQTNRESFINIINKQIEKLNLEQVFVISHNNAFDTCKMNLIMLPGSDDIKNNDDFMKNKVIVYDYSN